MSTGGARRPEVGRHQPVCDLIGRSSRCRGTGLRPVLAAARAAVPTSAVARRRAVWWLSGRDMIGGRLMSAAARRGAAASRGADIAPATPSPATTEISIAGGGLPPPTSTRRMAARSGIHRLAILVTVHPRLSSETRGAAGGARRRGPDSAQSISMLGRDPTEAAAPAASRWPSDLRGREPASSTRLARCTGSRLRR